MITRIAFNADFAQAIRVRALTLTEIARRTGLALATVSSAVDGRPMNLTTAVRIATAVSAAPVVAELETWGTDPHATQTNSDAGQPPSCMERGPAPARHWPGRHDAAPAPAQVRIHLG